MQPEELLDGRYRLVERIGSGGTSEVFRARDEVLEREVAIKRFAGKADDLSDEGRRRAEVRILAGLDHPSIVSLFDAVLDADPPYLVMELVTGTSLRDRIRRERLTPREADELGASVAAGLAAIHERGVVHRDVKPANILLAPDSSGSIKLVDFGIARSLEVTTATAAGTVLGTAGYLSPEQARGDLVGPPSDVYSLGLVLIEALTGERAFPGTTIEGLAARLARDPDLTASELHEHRDLLAAMTDREPARRPLARDVAEHLAHRGHTRPLPARHLAEPDATGMVEEVPRPVAATSHASARAVGVTIATGSPRRRDPGRRGMLLGGVVATLGLAAAGILAATQVFPTPLPEIASDEQLEPTETEPGPAIEEAVQGKTGGSGRGDGTGNGASGNSNSNGNGNGNGPGNGDAGNSPPNGNTGNGSGR